MGLKVDDSRAPYLQVADDLRQAIRAGSIQPGDKLPSTRELMDRYGIANMTVQAALRVLRDEGLIYSQPGRGSFVRQGVNEADQAPGSGHTPEFEILSRQLDAMTDEVRRLADRVSQLEEQAKPSGRGSKRAR